MIPSAPDSRLPSYDLESMDYFSGDHSLGSHRQFSRQSMGHLQSAAPAADEDKENVTTDVAAIIGLERSSARLDGSSRRLRSKSLGPGGLDALAQGSHNQRKVCSPAPQRCLYSSQSQLIGNTNC